MDGGVRQLEDGACIYESRTSNLSEKEQEEPSQAMGTIQRTNRWNHLGGIWVLLKRRGVVPTIYWNLLTHDATSNDATFQVQ